MTTPAPDRDPALPATVGDLASHEQREDLSLQALPSKVASRVFKREALLTIAILGVGAVGALGARAWAQRALDGGVALQLAPVVSDVAKFKQQTEAEQTAIKAEQTAIKAELTAVRIEVATTRAGVEMLLRAQGLVPPRSIHLDGGP